MREKKRKAKIRFDSILERRMLSKINQMRSDNFQDRWIGTRQKEKKEKILIDREKLCN